MLMYFIPRGGGGSTRINEIIFHFYGQKWIPGTQKHIFTYKTYPKSDKKWTVQQIPKNSRWPPPPSWISHIFRVIFHSILSWILFILKIIFQMRYYTTILVKIWILLVFGERNFSRGYKNGFGGSKKLAPIFFMIYTP